jgi:hypothetical protein
MHEPFHGFFSVFEKFHVPVFRNTHDKGGNDHGHGMHAEKRDLSAFARFGKGLEQLPRFGRRLSRAVEVDQQVNFAIDIINQIINHAVNLNTHFITNIAIQCNIKNVIVADQVVIFPRPEFPIADLIDREILPHSCNSIHGFESGIRDEAKICLPPFRSLAERLISSPSFQHLESHRSQFAAAAVWIYG